MTMNESRLIDLEIKFSHQEAAIEELQQTVHNQYLAIEKLEKALKVITDQLKTLTGVEGAANEKPPHY